jgi:hypothetical protein
MTLMTDAQAEAAPILVLVRDLIFASKIRATAQAIGATVQMLREPSQLQGSSGRRLIIDLNQPGALDAAVAWRAETGGAVMGFVSHVDSATIQTAREAGLQDVLPRSRFAQLLPELLG